MKKLIVLLSVALLPICMLAQKYPIEVLPGQEKVVSSSTDTLWVLKHSQLQKAILAAKENKILKEEIDVLKKKVDIGSNLGQETDSLLKLKEDEVLHYKENWLECDKDMQKVAKKYKQQKLLKNLGFIGMAVTFVLGAYLL